MGGPCSGQEREGVRKGVDGRRIGALHPRACWEPELSLDLDPGSRLDVLRELPGGDFGFDPDGEV